MKRFPTARYNALDTCKAEAQARGANVESACIQLLSNVQINLSRKVGGTAAKSVYLQLFQSGWHT
jgi:hypothetical protein